MRKIKSARRYARLTSGPTTNVFLYYRPISTGDIAPMKVTIFRHPLADTVFRNGRSLQ